MIPQSVTDALTALATARTDAAKVDPATDKVLHRAHHVEVQDAMNKAMHAVREWGESPLTPPAAA